MGPGNSIAQLEWEAFIWVDWFAKRRLLAPIGYIPPAKKEEKYYEKLG